MGAFLVVVTVLAAGLLTIVVYGEEIGPAHPVNAGQGIFAPMYRHWIEFLVLEWSIFIAMLTAYYVILGPSIGIHINWDVARMWVNRLNFLGSTLLIAGIVIAVIARQPLQIRDAIIPTICCFLLASITWIGSRNDSMISKTC
jgi:hypothetical protein